MQVQVITTEQQIIKRLFSDYSFRQKNCDSTFLQTNSDFNSKRQNSGRLDSERKFRFFSHARKNKKKDKEIQPTFTTFGFAPNPQATPSAKPKELNRPTLSFLIVKKLFIYLNLNKCELKKENVKIKKYYNLAFSCILLLKPSKFLMQTGKSKTPRQSVVVALLVCRVLGRTSITVGNLTTLFFYFKSDENVFYYNYNGSHINSLQYQNQKGIADKKMAVNKCLC